MVVTYFFDNAWGYNPIPEGPLASTLGSLNPLRYRSYVYDSETGYYYLQSRYYDPEIGRFINADGLITTGQGLLSNNMFAYCLNNPVLMYDSNGLRAVINNRCFGGGSSSNITSDGQGRSDELLALCVAETAQISQNEDFKLSIQHLGNQKKVTDKSVEQAKHLLLLGLESLVGGSVATLVPRIGKWLYAGIVTVADIASIINMGNDTEEFPDGFYDTYKISLSWTEAYVWEGGTTYTYHSYEFIVCWDTVSAATPQWQRSKTNNNTRTSIVYN